jgi:hypothetical protein
MTDKMKNKLNIKSLLALLVLGTGLLAACRDESIIVYDPIKQGVLGYYAHMIEAPDLAPAPGTVSAAAQAGATYKFTPEVVGATADEITSYEVFVELDNADGTVAKAKVPVPAGTITSFPVDATSKRPRGTVTVTAAQLNTALGITGADYIPGRFFYFHTKLNMKTRGSVDETNVNLNLAGAGYNSPFFHIVTIKP